MKIIGITPSLYSPGYKRLFEALGEILHLSFEERTFEDSASIAAWVVLGTEQEIASRVALADRPCYVVIPDDQLAPCGESPTIQFGTHTTLTGILRGRQISSDEAISLKALPNWLRSITALACKDGAAIWAIQDRHTFYHHFVAMPIPTLDEGEPLFTCCNGERFLALLPLLCFLTSLSEDGRWEYPALQATFMFDDPNLHWQTYGYVNFLEMMDHARRHNYHVSFATIPLDAWFVHAPTASLFKDNADRLSLLIHGNDHVSRELAQAYSTEQLDAILGQALTRIAAMEARTGLHVARVMAPPHGACSESSLSRMERLGFEAACISGGSLHTHNKNAHWPLTIGMRPCDIIAGLPVFPRFGLSDRCQNSVLVAALLHQPIIPRAHHQDLAEGLHLLADVSRLINSFGQVGWSGMTSISRSQYARMIDRSILSVKMLSKHIEVCVPEEINRLHILRPWLDNTASVPLRWRRLGETPQWNSHDIRDDIATKPGEIIEIVSGPFVPIRTEPTAAKSGRLFPVMRRLLTETRDRMNPSLRRIASIGRAR